MNILITRLQNIGDMMVFVPALRLLRQALPQARITLLCKHAGGIDIIKNCPYYDDMIIVKNRSLKEKIRIIRELRKRKLDSFIVSPQDRGRVPWALLGGAKKIVAFKKTWQCGVLKKEKLPFFINVHPKFDRDKTETENCVALVEAYLKNIGKAVPHVIDLSLEYSWTTKKSRNNVVGLLKENGLEAKKFFILAPFSAKCESRNWNNSSWLELSRWLQSKYHSNIVFIGGEAESTMVEELVSRETSLKFCNLCGKTSLDESCELMKHAAGFVGLDSGPAFLASAVGIPSVVLYGSGDIARWRPPQTSAPRINIYHKQECAPCRYKICPNNSLCMKAITPEEVKNAVRKSLKNSELEK
jgi:ADP-heptose:LPS heptosyltransferase